MPFELSALPSQGRAALEVQRRSRLGGQWQGEAVELLAASLMLCKCAALSTVPLLPADHLKPSPR